MLEATVDPQAIRTRYREVQERIRCAARDSGRDPAAVTLVAVSKNFPAVAVRALQPLAPVVIGENRVQEALSKMAEVGEPKSFQWHLVGHLQGNKAARAAEAFAMIQSVDSVRLLERLERHCLEMSKTLPILLEVNIGGEESKSGCREEELPALLEAAAGLTAVRVQGLLAVPPFLADPEQVRPYFRRLRELRDTLSRRFAGRVELPHLSMGMSHDFEVAIQEGATLVRVGTAIFGPRPTEGVGKSS